MQRNVGVFQCQKCAAGIAKHPAADRGQFTITYWLLYCKYCISCWSAATALLFPAFECFGGAVEWSVNILSTMARDELEIPLVGFSGRSQEKTHNLSIRCQDLPHRPQHADPNWPLRGSALPAARWVHRCIELPCSCLILVFYWWSAMPLNCCPVSDVFSVEIFSQMGSGCLSLDAVAFRKYNNESVWIYAKFTVGKELTVWQCCHGWSN